MIYAKQANIANGPQQINNGTMLAPAGGEATIEQNKRFEQQHGQWLDTGTQSAAIGADSSMATLG